MNSPTNPAPEPVYLFDVQGYDSERIRAVVVEAMREMGVKPKGRTLVKPNCVAAHPVYFTHAYTRPEVLDGVLAAVKEVGGDEISDLSISERSGITIPTRMGFHFAGFKAMAKKHGVPCRYFEDERSVEVALTAEGRLRDSILVPESIADADFMVNCPKFKTHPWTRVTLGLKNYIGIQDDAQRLIDHDYKLNEKIADLQEVIKQDLIVIDAVIAGKGRMLTPAPMTMNLLIVGKNPVATDAVGCMILDIDPTEVDHIRLSAEHGIGSLAAEDIELRGDVSLEEARQRAGFVENAMVPVGEFFEGSSIGAISGPPPDAEHSDYCWGGCPGAMEEAIDIITQIQSEARSDCRPMRVVYGDLRGKDLGEKPGETVVFLGDCTQYDGEVFGKQVNIESTYVKRHKKNPHKAKSKDVFVRMAIVYWIMAMTLLGRRKHLVIRGCPVSAAEHALLLASLGGLKNPYFDPRVVIPFVWTWLVTKSVRLFRKITGRLKPRLLDDK